LVPRMLRRYIIALLYVALSITLFNLYPFYDDVRSCSYLVPRSISTHLLFVAILSLWHSLTMFTYFAIPCIERIRFVKPFVAITLPVSAVQGLLLFVPLAFAALSMGSSLSNSIAFVCSITNALLSYLALPLLIPLCYVASSKGWEEARRFVRHRRKECIALYITVFLALQIYYVVQTFVDALLHHVFASRRIAMIYLRPMPRNVSACLEAVLSGVVAGSYMPIPTWGTLMGIVATCYAIAYLLNHFLEEI